MFLTDASGKKRQPGDPGCRCHAFCPDQFYTPGGSTNAPRCGPGLLSDVRSASPSAARVSSGRIAV